VGQTAPGRKYILCGHYDSVVQDTNLIGPGADDDASGCAAVLEAARVLSRYKTNYTVTYALWDREEGGGKMGSAAYADSAVARGDTILGVINLDMVGFDGDNDGVAEIHTNTIGSSVELANVVALLSTEYYLGITPVICNPGITRSDHRSFWEKGYSAVLLTEEYSGGDSNSRIHTMGDRILYFNLSYFQRMARLAAGSIALLAEIQDPLNVERNETVPPAIELEQNYPNPFNPSTTIGYALPRQSHITLTMFNTLGQQVATLVNGEVEPGYHEVQFNASRLASGMYFYRLYAGDFVETKRLMVLR